MCWPAYLLATLGLWFWSLRLELAEGSTRHERTCPHGSTELALVLQLLLAVPVSLERCTRRGPRVFGSLLATLYFCVRGELTPPHRDFGMRIRLSYSAACLSASGS